MFITGNKKSKKTMYRLWATTLIIITVVFGLVLIIYEDWQVDKDNLSGYVPSDSVYFYIHFNQRSPTDSWWPQLPLFNSFAGDLFPDFLNEFNFFSKQDLSEMAYVLFLDNGNLVSGWLLAVHDSGLSIDLPNQDWQRRSQGQVQAVSLQVKFLDKVLPAVTGKQNSLKKYLQIKKVNDIDANYFYLKADEKLSILPGATKLFALIDSSQFSDEWVFTHQPGWLQAQRLGAKSFFRLPSLKPKNSDWTQIFTDDSLVVYNLSSEQALILLENPLLPPNLQDIATTVEEKYQVSWRDFLPEVVGPISLALDLPQAEWLVKGKITIRGQDIIKQAVSLVAGYYNPQPEEVLLPDGSKVKELKVESVSLEYQKMFINEQPVSIVYFNKNSYFVWFEEGEEIVLGNSLKMINQYIIKKSANIYNPCLAGAGQAIIMNLPEFQEIFSIKRLVISSNNGLTADKFSFCYE